MADTREFLSSLQSQLDGLRNASKVYNSRLAISFNVFCLFRPCENSLSEIIADLLNHKGTHAQGRKFWDAFANCFNLKELMNDAKEVEIKLEDTTESLGQSRRIDIVAEIVAEKDKKSILAIENKPWARDQRDQINDYLCDLKNRYGDCYVLIYLSGDGNPPGEESLSSAKKSEIENSGQLRIISYGDLLPWLDKCRAVCEAPSVAEFLRSFGEYIQKEFLGVKDMTETNVVIDAAMKNLGTAMELIVAADQIRNKLLSKLRYDLENVLPEIKNRIDAEIFFEVSDKWSFTFRLASGKNVYGLVFEFHRPKNYRNFYYGIRNGFGETALPHLDGVFNALNDKFARNGSEKPGEWWTWWQWGEPRDWDSSKEPWLQIADGEMKEWIFDTTVRVYECLKEKELINQLHAGA
jgi:hypothetical protein